MLVLVLVPMGMRMGMAVPQVAVHMLVRMSVLMLMRVSMFMHVLMFVPMLTVLGAAVLVPVAQSLPVGHPTATPWLPAPQTARGPTGPPRRCPASGAG